MFLAGLSSSLKRETIEDGSSRTILKLPAKLDPTKAANLPQVKKTGLPELAQENVDNLKWDFQVQYDEKDAIGRRYRRQDAAGTPLCITVDHESLEDKSVTVRFRDSMEQKRVKITELQSIIKQEIDFKAWI